MRDQIIQAFNTAVKRNADLVGQYGHSVNEGPEGFIELKIRGLSLIQVSKPNDRWRIVSSGYTTNTASRVGLNVQDVNQQGLLTALDNQLETSFRDLRHHHDVWNTLAII